MPSMAKDSYAIVHRTALAVLPKKAPGITLEEFLEEMATRLPKVKGWDPSASASWYAMAIKLDMEARGELKRVNKKPPQRIVRLYRLQEGAFLGVGTAMVYPRLLATVGVLLAGVDHGRARAPAPAGGRDRLTTGRPSRILMSPFRHTGDGRRGSDRCLGIARERKCPGPVGSNVEELKGGGSVEIRPVTKSSL